MAGIEDMARPICRRKTTCNIHFLLSLGLHFSSRKFRKNFLWIVFLFVICISFAKYASADNSSFLFPELGQSVQDVIKTQNISSYIDRNTKSLITNTDTYSILAQQKIFNESGTFLYYFYKHKLVEYSIQLKTKNTDSCYSKIISSISKRYTAYTGSLFKNIDDKFIHNNTLVLLIKDKGIFLYFIDIEAYKQSRSW